MARTEKQKVEKPLIDGITRIGGKCHKFECPGRTGAPDRIVVLPRGKVVFVELKAPQGIMSPMQRVWRDELLGLGCDWRCLSSREEVNEFVAEMEAYVASKVRA